MVYVHVPFCRSFCVYCDFYSELACKGRDAGLIAGYAEQVCREAAERSEEIKASLGTNTLYIGGGTPSVLPPDVLGRIISAVKKAAEVDGFEELTIEVNPEDIASKGDEYVLGLLELGVSRVSMGLQSLDDGILRWMGRRHDARRAREAVSILKRCGVENLSLDIITGISGLSDEMLYDTVSEVIAMRPQHISSYQHSIEEGSALDRMVERGVYVEASEEQCRSQYEMLCRRLAEAGYVHYEISNWALPGFESRHNSAYWTREPYVGLGPGAHSLTKTVRPAAAEAYGAAGLTGAAGAALEARDGTAGSAVIVDERRSWNSQELSGWTREEELLSAEEIREERLMLGLRTAQGIDGKRIAESDWFIADSIIADLV